MAVPIETLIRSYWHLVAHRSEVAEPGDFVRLSWAPGDLVLYNDDGEVIAFDNVCPHRGGRFFIEDRGNARAICPYHGWSIRAGEVRVTRREEFTACDLAKAVLTRFRTAWRGDFLFVGIEPAMTLDEQLGQFGGKLADISREMTAPRDLYKIDFQANWRVGVENALEAYHVNIIHRDTLAPMALSDGEDTYAGLNSAFHARIGNQRMARGLKGLRRFLDLRADFEGYCTYYVFPFAMLSSPFGYSYALQSFMPGDSPDRSWFYSRLYSSRAAEGAESFLDSLMVAMIKANRQIFDEDHEICRRVSPRYDLDNPDRIYAASEGRVRALAEGLRRIELGVTPLGRSRTSA